MAVSTFPQTANNFVEFFIIVHEWPSYILLYFIYLQFYDYKFINAFKLPCIYKFY